METIIQVDNLTKTFGNKVAVSDLSFDVRKGEVFAFLGGNGSGKTTTIRCLLNIYQPTKGVVYVYGREYDNTVASRIGYLPEERGLYVTSRVLETLVYFGELKGMSHDDAQRKAIEYLEIVGLSDKANSEIKTLSSGQQQKIQLGVAIINQPELLILDEPTKGLDPVNRKLLMEQLMKLNRAGSTVIFITHQMDEVEKIADRLVMIKEGRRVLYGSVEGVKQQFGSNIIHVVYDGEIPENNGMYSVARSKHSAEITPLEDVSTHAILKYLLEQNVAVKEFKIATPSLEEVFVIVSEGDNHEYA